MTRAPKGCTIRRASARARSAIMSKSVLTWLAMALSAAVAIAQERPAPAKALRAVSAVSGSSTTVPRTPGYFFSIAIISAPLPPPTSIRCPRDPQSYASRIAGKSAATSEPICASNEAKREGSAARSSQNDVPNCKGNAGSPARTECRSWTNDRSARPIALSRSSMARMRPG